MKILVVCNFEAMSAAYVIKIHFREISLGKGSFFAHPFFWVSGEGMTKNLYGVKFCTCFDFLQNGIFRNCLRGLAFKSLEC